MCTSKNPKYLQLLLLSNNQLIFRVPKSQAPSPPSLKPLNLKNFQSCISTKNLKEKRTLLRQAFEPKSSNNSKPHLKPRLQIIGKSESKIHSRNTSSQKPALTTKPPSRRQTTTVQSNESCKFNIEDALFYLPNSRTQSKRKIVLITNNKLEASEIEEQDEHVIIKSRYF